MNGIKRWKNSTSISLLNKKRKSVLVQTGNGMTFFADWHSPWLHPILSSMCRQLRATKCPLKMKHRQQKFWFLFFRLFYLFVWPIPNLLFFSFIFMQRWTQNDVHFLWRHFAKQHSIRKRICVSSGFQFVSLLTKWRRRKKKREKQNNEIHEKNGIFSRCFCCLWIADASIDDGLQDNRKQRRIHLQILYIDIDGRCEEDVIML